MLLDDHGLVLRGLHDLLKKERKFNVVASFMSSRAMLNGLRNNDVDVLVMDYSLAPDDLDGISLIKHLQNHHPNIELLVVSAYYTSTIVSQALRAGVKGFIGKNVDPENISRAIQRVANGRVYLEPSMLDEVLILRDETKNKADSRSRAPLSTDILSPKELEVIRCILEGMTVSAIALKFNRSLKTISGQKQSALRKLGIQSDHELFLLRDHFS